jgi:hypothetical protein
MKSSKKFVLSLFAAVVFFNALGFVFDTAVSAHDEGAGCGQECKKQLADLRAATAKYHDVEEAVVDGYVPMGGCVALPSGPAMGIHYVNFNKVIDGQVSVTDPEVLVYIPESDGSLRLVAAEYMIPIALSPEAPELYGQQFHPGPMETWTLHAWVWRNNPEGMFADFNAKLSCPAVQQ